MGICGHTFTTSDQDSCVSINHTVPVFSPLWCMFATCFYSGVIPACVYVSCIWCENFPVGANIAFTYEFSPLFFFFKNKIVFT